MASDKSLAAEIGAILRKHRVQRLITGSEEAMEAAIPQIAAEIATLQSRALEAEIFARRVHAGQVDKGGAPYTGHLGRVASRARAHAEAIGLPSQHAEWCQQVGWLHDTIEDTPTEADDLLDAGFDPAVVQAVQLLTRPEGKPYLGCVAGIIASGDRLAMIVKLSDNEDNLDPARALPTASPEYGLRYQRSAEMLRAALALTPSTTARGDGT
ncbi:hypothetical protein ASF36_16365 [Methylobacterium sp. Leaf90]|nr:hypothetical protein ASF36_16365 [Methylobacterium sp. Leaf90]